MKVGDLVRLRRARQKFKTLGLVTKMGENKFFVEWQSGYSNWCVSSMLEVVNASR